MNSELLIGTNNPGKLLELQALLSGLGLRLHTPASLGIALEIEESGTTYKENARIKARTFCEVSGLPVLADDTGLEVASLGGAPGLHSKRFSPNPHATDTDRRKLLLKKLAGKPRPWTSRFVCTAAFALPGGKNFFFEGECPGEIIPRERGENGFGYDRIFLVSAARQTMAELPFIEKNRLSHRARAVKGIIPLIRENI